MYDRIYLMMNVLLLWFNATCRRNNSSFSLQSVSNSYANTYVNVFKCLCLQWMFGVV